MHEILQRIAGRKHTGRWGIGSAAHYLRDVNACLAGGYCPEKVFQLADASAWQSALKAAEDRLTYADDETNVLEFKGTASKAAKLVIPNAIAELDCIATTTRKDRDGDILECSGCEVDPRMALLWQHIAIEPCGKLVEVLDQNEKRVSLRGAIADTKLGNDAATLVEFGALRISHGFDPRKYEPMFAEKASRKAEDEFIGWHVLEYEMLEFSLVSIPSNKDAVITNFSRNKLHHPAVKRWAKEAFDARPVQGRGAAFRKNGKKQITVTTTVDIGDDRPNPSELGTEAEAGQPDKAGKDAAPAGSACGCKTKDTQAPEMKLDKLYVGALEGSWEWIGQQLYQSLKTFMVGKGLMSGSSNEWVYVEAMFPTYAIVCVSGYSPERNDLYSVAWTTTDEKPQWSGDPVKVELQVAIAEAEKALLAKALSVLKSRDGQSPLPVSAAKIAELAKAGRVLSQKNSDALSDACDLMTEAKDHKDQPKPCKALLKEAHGLVKGVLDAATPESDDEEELDEEKARVALIRAASECDLDSIERQRQFAKNLLATLDLRQRDLDDDEWTLALAEMGIE